MKRLTEQEIQASEWDRILGGYAEDMMKEMKKIGPYTKNGQISKRWKGKCKSYLQYVKSSGCENNVLVYFLELSQKLAGQGSMEHQLFSNWILALSK